MAIIMAEAVGGIILQDEVDVQIAAIPFDPWCCADPWRRVTVEGVIGTVPEVAGYFQSPIVVFRYEGATDLTAVISFLWFDGDVSGISLGGAWVDPTTGASDWGVPFNSILGPEGANSPRSNPGDPYRMTVDWNANGGDPTFLATFYVNGVFSVSFYVSGVDDAFLAYGYPTVPDPTAVGVALNAWGGSEISGPLLDVRSLDVTCLPAPSSFPSLTGAWQDL